MFIRTLAVVIAISAIPALAADTRVVFDLPSAIECRDKTPCDFTSAHPSLKVIEAKFRISARVVEGSAADIVDFVYVLKSTDKTMRLQDYLPNTTMESAVAEDQIEVTRGRENSATAGADAHVAYKIFTLGATLNQTSKKTEANHYKQIAAKEFVLASGTTDREHGVFFRLRPSRAAALEGAKEFAFLAIVPLSWRGDLCTISCAARATKSSVFSTSVVPAGAEQLRLGIYLCGDGEAAALADELRSAQEAHAALVAHPIKENVFDTISHQTTSLFTGKKADSPLEAARKKLDDAQRAVVDAEEHLKQLAH